MASLSLDNIKLTKLSKIKNEKGEIFQIMKNSDVGFIDYGEAYFSWILKDMKKGWKRHKSMSLNLCVPYGCVKFIFKINKDDIIREEIIGEDDYFRITVPPNIWFAMIGIGDPRSLILNIGDILHDKNEVESMTEEQFSTIGN